MDFYKVKANETGSRLFVADDMFRTRDLPTTAGSKMLQGYMSLFNAQVLDTLKESGFTLSGKSKVGEFAIDLMGETDFEGTLAKDGILLDASCEIVKAGQAEFTIVDDVNGSPRRAAAQSGLINLKPTYGTVSRFGIIGTASSGETVGITAKMAKTAKEVLSVISGHDDKDGTSLPEDSCKKVMEEGKSMRVAVLENFLDSCDDEVKAKIERAKALLEKEGVTVDFVSDEVIFASRIAWNILMSAETCNNVSRFDGVKYGYRTNSFTNIDELYTKSRTEAFGDLIKTCILFGSETLSTDNYMPVYDKALRIRRKVCEAFASLFAKYDAILLPATSKMAYTVEEVKANKELAYEENLFTAPASITGLPALTAGGVQFIAGAFQEGKLFDIAEKLEKEAEV